jgi:iron uptake system component EfeO
MHRRRCRVLAATCLGVALLGAGCGDDGDDESADSATALEDPQVVAAATAYTAYVREQADTLVSDTKVFTDAVRAGDVTAAKAAYAPSRQAWERIEPIAGLVETIDVAVDARVDDFENEEDPAWTGWHKLEWLLWTKGDIGPTSGASRLADQLDADIAQLQKTMATTEIPADAIPTGAAELIEEVSAGKITGEEDRYSGTDLWDFAANVEGSEEAFSTLEAATRARDADLVEEINEGFTAIDTALAAYEDGSGYQPFSALTESDTDKMKTTLADLSEKLSQVSGVLGLG